MPINPPAMPAVIGSGAAIPTKQSVNTPSKQKITIILAMLILNSMIV